jgi:hypothetical protein
MARSSDGVKSAEEKRRRGESKGPTGKKAMGI